MTPLTRDVLRYQETGEGLKRLVDQISRSVYQFPGRQNGFSDEDGAEFLLRFLPRITRLIERYRDSGRPFDSYLSASLRWQMRSFAADRTAERMKSVALVGPGSELRSVERDRTAPPVLHVCESAENRSANSGTLGKISGGQRRRLIHLSLKMAERLDEPDYRRIARVTGCDPEWLIACWHELQDRCAERRERGTLLREQRDRAWFRVRCIEYRLRLTLTEDERQHATQRLAAWRRRYEHARRVLARMRADPSHAEVAAVLGIPKGTVDSSIFYAKREFTDPRYRAVLARLVAKS